MSKELLYLLCSKTLKERELYEIFRACSSAEDVERNVSSRFTKSDINESKELLKKLFENNVKITAIFEKNYPQILKFIDYPPPILFYKGEYLENDMNGIAFVGSRDASIKGIEIVERFISDMKGLPVTIISGLARGIDTCAHEKAIQYGLRTVAVLGNGIDIVYPASNRRLYYEICEKGCIFSEFPPQTPPMPYHFPRRNRIISGLSKAVVIIEAGKKSGSLITARFAIEQGKELFAVPRTPLEKNAWGNNMLIKNGAKIATEAKDIIEEIFPNLKIEKREMKEIALSQEEREIISHIGEEPVNFDSLCFLLDKGPATLANFLLQLELKGVIKALPGKNYIKIVGEQSELQSF